MKYQENLLDEYVQVAEEVFLLSRTVRTFGTEQPEKERYQRRLGILRHISIRQAAAYLLYLTSNSFLFNLTKVRLTLTAVRLRTSLVPMISAISLTHIFFAQAINTNV